LAAADFWSVVSTFQESVQPAISAFGPSILRLGPISREYLVGDLRLSEDPISIPGTAALSLSVALRFRVALVSDSSRSYELQTTAYAYLLLHEGAELLAYHWDSDAGRQGAVAVPHAHIGKKLLSANISEADRRRINVLSKSHAPTGLVPFTSLIRMLMRDHGAQPRLRANETELQRLERVSRALKTAEQALAASLEWAQSRSWE
jgi:hypothetical protein